MATATPSWQRPDMLPARSTHSESAAHSAMTNPRRRVRSALFTPGTEAARLRKAVTSGADVCIFDLEDSVPAARIGDAREIVREALEELTGRARIWLRVHPASSREMAEDLRTMPLSTLEAVVLPKVSDWDDVEACRRAMKQARIPTELPVVPIIESAAGVLGCAAIAEVTGVACLALGRFDLAADLGIDPDGTSPALAMARASVVLASTAVRLGLPLDSPWLKITDLSGLRAAAERARRLRDVSGLVLAPGRRREALSGRIRSRPDGRRLAVSPDPHGIRRRRARSRGGLHRARGDQRLGRERGRLPRPDVHHGGAAPPWKRGAEAPLPAGDRGWPSAPAIDGRDRARSRQRHRADHDLRP